MGHKSSFFAEYIKRIINKLITHKTNIMKKLLILITVILFFSCNNGPEPYRKAIVLIENGSYEKAIDMLRKVKDEDGKWFDSAIVRRNEAFEKLLAKNDWERISPVLEDENNDKQFRREMKKIIVNFAKKIINAGYVDTVIITFGINENTIKNFDTNCITKISDLIENKVLKGNWKCVQSHTNAGYMTAENFLINFIKNGSTIEAKSFKNNGNGWSKDKVMYIVGKYFCNLSWKCQPRIFQSTYWDEDSYEYFGQLGGLKIFNSDSIFIDYGQSGLNATFIREKNNTLHNSKNKKK